MTDEELWSRYFAAATKRAAELADIMLAEHRRRRFPVPSKPEPAEVKP